MAPAELRRLLPWPSAVVDLGQDCHFPLDPHLLDSELPHCEQESHDAGGADRALSHHLLQDGTVSNDQSSVPGLPVRNAFLVLTREAIICKNNICSVAIYFCLFGFAAEPFLELIPTTSVGKMKLFKDKSGMNFFASCSGVWLCCISGMNF